MIWGFAVRHAIENMKRLAIFITYKVLIKTFGFQVKALQHQICTTTLSKFSQFFFGAWVAKVLRTEKEVQRHNPLDVLVVGIFY